MESRACTVYHSNISDVKAAVDQVWAVMDQTYVKKPCSTFRKCLDLSIAAEGSVIEK